MRQHYKTLMLMLLVVSAIKSLHAQITVSASAGTSSGSYTTLKDAIDNINNGTHQGAIDIRVHTNSTETGAITLVENGNSSGATYTAISIRPADTATVAKIISLNLASTSLFTFNGADNVTIDGRPLGAGSNRLLTFSNLSNSNSSHTLVFQNDATNNLVTYTNLLNSRNNTNATRATVASVIQFGNASSATSNSSNTFTYNVLTGGNMGINFNGSSLTNPSDLILIKANQFNSQVVTSIRLDTMVKDITIDSNNFSHPTAVPTNGYQAVNIAHIHPSGTVTITRNRVFNINTSTANFAQGIIFSPLTPSGTLIVRNNSITIGSTTFPNTLSQIIRCFLFGGAQSATVTVEHNTFRIGGTHVTANGNPTTVGALKSNSSAGTVFTFRNNLCINTRTGSANQHVGAFFSTPVTGSNTIDYNTYNGGGVFTTAWIGTFHGTIATYKAAATPNEQNSAFGVMDFVNTTDPNLIVSSPNNTGAKIVGTPSTVTEDIYGTTRSGATPFRGAFEGPSSMATTNDLQTVIIYTFGKIPTGTIDTARAIIRNCGAAAAVNVPVYLHSSLSGLIGSVNVSLPPAGEATINLAPYTPTLLGFDTLRVFPAPDQLAANDTFIWVRENTLNSLSYTRPFVNQTGNVGTNPDGEIVAKFTTPVPNFINQVNVNFTNVGFNGPWPFQVVIYPDSGGANGPSRNPIYVSGTQNTINGVYNLSLPSIPVSGSFYVGVRQPTSNNIGFAFQNENPIRNQTFYFRQGAGYQTLAWNDFAVNPNNQFRFMIEPRLKINDDLGVIEVLTPAAGCADTASSKEVRVTIQNLGLLPQNFGINPLQVYGTITNPSNVTSTFGPISVASGTIASDDTISVALTSSYNMSIPGNYVIKAWCQLSIDNNKVNDTLPNTTRIVTIPFAAPYTQTLNASTALPAELTTNRFVVTAGAGVNNTNALRVNLFNTTPFNANAFVFLPRVTGVTANTHLRFDYRFTNFTGGGATTLTNVDSMNIFVSTDCGETFTKVSTVVGSMHTPTTGFTTMDIPLATYVGQNVRVKIQFDWFGTTNDAFVDIDNIRILNITSDLSAIGSSSPCAALIAGGTPVAPTATLRNTGTTTASLVNVVYNITGPASYSGTGGITSLNINDVTLVTFTPTFTPTVAGTYTAKIFASFPGDSDPLNDTFYYTFNVVNTAGVNAGNALSFNGTTSAEVTNLSSLNLSGSAMSVQAWINRNATGTGNRTIISKDSSIIKGQYALWLNAANNLVFTLNTSAGANAIVSVNPIPAGTYTHVAATYDGTNMSIYINGNLEGTVVQTGTVVPNLVTLKIGQNYNNERFVGEIDELQIWNTALDPHTIRSNMHKRTANAASANLLAYYRFDEGTGLLSVDASGNCNTLTLPNGGAPTWIAATYPLAVAPTTNMQVVTVDGPAAFTGTGLTINYTGFTGLDSVYVHKIAGAPVGTSPTTVPGGVTAVHANSWLAYRYGSGAFTNANLVFTLGAGNLISGVVVGDLSLFNRANGTNGGWTASNTGATAVSFASQSVTFAQTNSAFFAKQLAIGANNNPLPVKLIYFNGKRDNADVQLTWVTASETDNAGFSLERSTDGKLFEKVAYVEGQGNSKETSKYLWVDEAAFATTGSQTLYYRLVQTDFSGKETISQVVSVTANSDEDVITALYPNPFTSELTFTIDSKLATAAKVIVADIAGKKVMESTHNLLTGMNNLETASLENLPKGVYMVQLTVNGHVTTYKLVKQ